MTESGPRTGAQIPGGGGRESATRETAVMKRLKSGSPRPPSPGLSSRPELLDPELMPADGRLAEDNGAWRCCSGTPAGLGDIAINTRRSEAILAGLPAHVMDELVEDLAEAVVAILLSQGTTEPDEDEHASGDLR